MKVRKRCIYCGRDNNESDKYCSYCGEELSSNEYHVAGREKTYKDKSKDSQHKQTSFNTLSKLW